MNSCPCIQCRYKNRILMADNAQRVYDVRNCPNPPTSVQPFQIAIPVQAQFYPRAFPMNESPTYYPSGNYPVPEINPEYFMKWQQASALTSTNDGSEARNTQTTARGNASSATADQASTSQHFNARYQPNVPVYPTATTNFYQPLAAGNVTTLINPEYFMNWQQPSALTSTNDGSEARNTPTPARGNASSATADQASTSQYFNARYQPNVPVYPTATTNSYQPLAAGNFPTMPTNQDNHTNADYNTLANDNTLGPIRRSHRRVIHPMLFTNDHGLVPQNAVPRNVPQLSPHEFAAAYLKANLIFLNSLMNFRLSMGLPPLPPPGH